MALQEQKWGPRQTHTHGPSAHEATKNRHSLSSWELEPNQGPSAARTHGTQAARLVAKRPQQHDPWRRPPGALSLPPAACLSPRAQLPQGTLCSHPHWFSREEKRTPCVPTLGPCPVVRPQGRHTCPPAFTYVPSGQVIGWISGSPPPCRRQGLPSAPGPLTLRHCPDPVYAGTSVPWRKLQQGLCILGPASPCPPPAVLTNPSHPCPEHADDLGALDRSPAGSSVLTVGGDVRAPLLSRPTAALNRGARERGLLHPHAPNPQPSPPPGCRRSHRCYWGGYSISAYQRGRPGGSLSHFSPSPRATFCVGLQKQAEDWAARGMTFSQGNCAPSPGTCALAWLLSAHRGSSPECLIFVCSSPIRGLWESG